jgi:hypothetical protein
MVSDSDVDVKHCDFREWAKEKIEGLSEIVLAAYEEERRTEKIIEYVNSLLCALSKKVPYVPLTSMTLQRVCLEGSMWLTGAYRWYPVIYRQHTDDDRNKTPNGVLVLGVVIYDVSYFRKKETYRDKFLLSYTNMNHLPEVEEAYRKCVEAIPALLLAYINLLTTSKDCHTENK